MDYKFALELNKIGIVAYNEQENLWQIAKRCAASSGISMAGFGAVIGFKTGSVVVPGIGTIAGPIVGALTGLVSGTFSCTLLNVAMKDELKKIAQGN